MSETTTCGNVFFNYNPINDEIGDDLYQAIYLGMMYTNENGEIGDGLFLF